MFSALKRLTTRSGPEGNGTSATPAGHHAMSQNLQKKFSRGVQYNMKIILKGDRNSGKTCLFRRLQALPFLEEYTPTDEIQVANIQWNYKATDDIVKVEIWDVVDKSKKKKNIPGKLKLDNIENSSADNFPQEEIALDASFLDVYKGTNGVILIFDITKGWTFDYVKRELAVVPPFIPVLILGNMMDMGHHRTISADTVQYFIDSLEREPGNAEVRYSEASMRNGFGLKLIHKFFNLPYLQLQRETLLKQLEINNEENLLTIQELNFYLESDDANYDLFIDSLTQKRRINADALSPPVPKITLSEAQTLALEKSKEVNEAPTPLNFITKIAKTATTSKEQDASVRSSSAQSSLNSQGTNPSSNNGTKVKAGPISPANKPTVLSPSVTAINTGPIVVDDFAPDPEHRIDKSFFSDEPTNSNTTSSKVQKNDFDMSSDEEGAQGNPMVTSYTEDIIPEEWYGDLKSSSSNNTKPEAATDSDEHHSEDEFNAKSSSRPNHLVMKEPLDIFMEKSTKSKKVKHSKSKSKQKKSTKTPKPSTDFEHFLNGTVESSKDGQALNTDAYEAL